MELADGTESIADDELLYRRIPVSQRWYLPNSSSTPFPLAFSPRPGDKTGLSLYRAKYKSLHDAARGPSKQGYYVAVLQAGDLRSKGIDISPAPLPGDPGHCELQQLTYENRDKDLAKAWMGLLADELCLRVEGPFPPNT